MYKKHGTQNIVQIQQTPEPSHQELLKKWIEQILISSGKINITTSEMETW